MPDRVEDVHVAFACPSKEEAAAEMEEEGDMLLLVPVL